MTTNDINIVASGIAYLTGTYVAFLLCTVLGLSLLCPCLADESIGDVSDARADDQFPTVPPRNASAKSFHIDVATGSPNFLAPVPAEHLSEVDRQRLESYHPTQASSAAKRPTSGFGPLGLVTAAVVAFDKLMHRNTH